VAVIITVVLFRGDPVLTTVQVRLGVDRSGDSAGNLGVP
jgi:hypothetical protein